MHRPQLWVVAGPNGAGKTTLTSQHFAGRIPVVNPDEIANRIDPQHQGSSATMVAAGRLAIAERQLLLSEGKSFAVETTLTGKGELHLMRQAADRGYKVNLFFVGLDDAQLSAGRVAQRVRSGGHPVPLDDIFRRFDRSLSHLSEALMLADRAFVLDNSGLRRQLLLSLEGGRVKHMTKQLPDWAKTAIPTGMQRAASHNRSMGR
ncbi:TPA: zeta toxin family protein [Burkholderia multivorans]|nr:zeta toxin family protein [Burkholderia multivorans]HDR9480230.1 zeta toxin family protein [Burkholderia multivorans]